jgi:uracil-DNA glycosylase
VGITKLRGQVYPWWRRHLVPTLHPAAALRGGDQVVEQMRADFRLAKETLEQSVAVADPAVEQLGLFG